jgi:hypothetical protein
MAVKLNKELSDALSGCEELEAVDPVTGRVYMIVDSALYRQAREKRTHEAIQRGIDSVEAGGGIPLDEADSQLRKELGFPLRQ